MKTVVLALALTVVFGNTSTVMAVEGVMPVEPVGMTKEQFVKTRLELARNNPHWKPTREELDQSFAKLDANADGLLTEEKEQAAGKKSKPK